jgi:hypothetical protein
VLPAAGGGPLPAHVLGVFTPDDLAVIRVTSGAGSLHPAYRPPMSSLHTCG